jgi:hypothetical protein
MALPPQGRIDVHQHLMPEFYRQHLLASGYTAAGGVALLDWTTSKALRLMDRLGTAAAMRSPR